MSSPMCVSHVYSEVWGDVWDMCVLVCVRFGLVFGFLVSLGGDGEEHNKHERSSCFCVRSVSVCFGGGVWGDVG